MKPGRQPSVFFVDKINACMPPLRMCHVTMLAAGLDFGATQVIGIEQQKKYIRIAEKRIVEG
jgi:hypothetical protein